MFGMGKKDKATQLVYDNAKAEAAKDLQAQKDAAKLEKIKSDAYAAARWDAMSPFEKARTTAKSAGGKAKTGLGYLKSAVSGVKAVGANFKQNTAKYETKTRGEQVARPLGGSLGREIFNAKPQDLEPKPLKAKKKVVTYYE